MVRGCEWKRSANEKKERKKRRTKWLRRATSGLWEEGAAGTDLWKKGEQQEGVPYVPVRERWSAERERQRKKKRRGEGVRPRAKVRHRARRGGMHVPEQCGGDVSPKHCAKVGGSVVSQKKGDGGGTWKVSLCQTRHKVLTVGNSPKSDVALTRSAYHVCHFCHFSHSSPPPHQQRLFTWQRTSIGKILFFLSFPLIITLFPQVHRGPFLCKCEWGVSRAVSLVHLYVFFSFSFFTSPLTAPFPHRCTRTPFRSQGGLTFS